MSEKSIIVFQSEGTFNSGIILTKSNYDVWSQLVEMHIAEREKLSYIRGKTNLPKESEDGYEKWYAENQKVKRWLLMSMSPEIMKHYLRLPTAQEILSALSKAFYDEREILRKDPLPDLEECYALIQREALRHASMKAESDNPDTSAMVVRQQLTRNWQDQSKTNHPKTDHNIDKSTFKCTHYNKTGHTKSRCFEIVGYPDWWDHNRDQQKKNSKKTSTATIAEIKTEANVDEKASALIAATDYGDKSHPLDLPHKNLFPQPMDIQTRQTIGFGIKRGKLYYLDLQSNDSNKLRQALMADGSEEEKKKMTWLYLMKTKDEVNLLFQKFHKMIETQYNAKVRVLRSDNGGEYQSSDLQKYLEGHGIIHQTTCSNTPQQNGVVERKNRHLLEGEYHKEIQTLDYDYHISKENESGQSELVNQEVGELDMRGQQFGSEDVFTEISNQSSSVEGVLNLEPDPFMKRLPHRHNLDIRQVVCLAPEDFKELISSCFDLCFNLQLTCS
ncbi:Retrovirus-related Pol polyprotein from transposon TNT 1-94 [Vitis vinifera]|uniref:Retrovirus-related Pol polyprotein from transposon TNT 1-94 n=1 Tax=Vitis vinifera TaxID=29760 RepID=A0A438JUN2_VITVI|nr:Retrovirus-related Pol polyprotein from transposon TNT 1-94 [Vitis vinifera]